MKNIEVEIRSFINKSQFLDLKRFFNKKAKFIKGDFQETYYLDSRQDLRLQKNKYFAKIWLKSGKIHDEVRDEIEIKIDRKDFEKTLELFGTLGFKTKVKWLRKRLEYRWQGISIYLDHTKGYGYIIELEKKSSKSKMQKNLSFLKEKLKDLDILLTPREIFERKFKFYQKNWQKLI